MEFINRKKDRKEFVQLLHQNQNNNRIVLLNGYSGVGKTGLIRYLFSTEFVSHNCIQVHISKNSVDTIENGAYFNALYKELVQYSFNSRGLVSTPRKFGLINHKKIWSVIINIIKSKIGMGENDKLYENTDEISIIHKRDYILFVLKKTPFLIDFENIQNIDTQSMELLRDIIKNTKSNIFIFEFTLSKENDNAYRNFYSEVSDFNAEIVSYFLEKIDFEEAVNLLPRPLNDIEKEKQLKAIYNSSHGNLLQIKLALDMSDKDTDDIIYESLENLSPDELYILNVIYLNGGFFHIASLKTLLTTGLLENTKSISFSQYKQIIQELLNKGVLDVKDTIYTIHDSIIDILKNQNPGPALYHAYSLLTKYYLEIKSTHQKHDSVFHLFSLYINFADERILEILPDIRDIILKSKYPQTIIEELNHFKEKLLEKPSLNPKVFFEICFLLTEVCIEIEDEEIARTNFSLIPSDDNSFKYQLLNAKLLALGVDKQNMDLIQDIEIKYPPASRERLLIEICRLRYMLRAYPQKETLLFAQELLDNTSYQVYNEYGFLLINAAELADSPYDAICMYQKAAEIFSRDYDTKKYIAFCDINLCMSYGYRGQLQVARKCIERAEKSSEIKLAYVLNNSAVLDLLEGKCGYQTIKNLLDSLFLTTNHFEQLIIRNNLLIAYTLSGATDKAEKECGNIESSNFESYNYGEFLQMNYQNLLNYYSHLNNYPKIEFYNQKIDSLIQLETTSEGTKEIALLMKNGEKKSDIFYSSFSYRAEFLCYWGIPADFYSQTNDVSI